MTNMTRLDLPEMPGLKSLLTQMDAHTDMYKMVASAILALGTGIDSYRDRQHGLVQTEADRLANAVNDAARHFLLLAATHGIK